MWPSEALLLVRTWFSSTNNIDWRSKKEGGFSSRRTMVHNLIILHINAYWAEWITKLLNLQGVMDMYLCWTLFNSAKIEAFLRLCCPGKSSLDFPIFLWRLGFSNVAKHVVMDTCCQAIHYSTCDLLPCWVLRSLWVGSIFLCSFDVAPITLTNKVLVHLVLVRCKVVSVQLLGGKRVAHFSIYGGRCRFLPSSSLLDTSYVVALR